MLLSDWVLLNDTQAICPLLLYGIADQNQIWWGPSVSRLLSREDTRWVLAHFQLRDGLSIWFGRAYWAREAWLSMRAFPLDEVEDLLFKSPCGCALALKFLFSLLHEVVIIFSIFNRHQIIIICLWKQRFVRFLNCKCLRRTVLEDGFVLSLAKSIFRWQPLGS